MNDTVLIQTALLRRFLGDIKQKRRGRGRRESEEGGRNWREMRRGEGKAEGKITKKRTVLYIL